MCWSIDRWRWHSMDSLHVCSWLSFLANIVIIPNALCHACDWSLRWSPWLSTFRRLKRTVTYLSGESINGDTLSRLSDPYNPTFCSSCVLYWPRGVCMSGCMYAQLHPVVCLYVMFCSSFASVLRNVWTRDGGTQTGESLSLFNINQHSNNVGSVCI